MLIDLLEGNFNLKIGGLVGEIIDWWVAVLQKLFGGVQEKG